MPLPWMNAPFFKIVVRFRSEGRSMSSRQSNAGPETDVANRTWHPVIFYSDKSPTTVEQLAQKLSCLIQWKQVPLVQELLATKVHSHDTP